MFVIFYVYFVLQVARCFCYIVASLSLTAGSPFFNLGTSTHGAIKKNKNSANALNPILPAKTQPPVASVFTAQQPKPIRYPVPTSSSRAKKPSAINQGPSGSSAAVRNTSKAKPLPVKWNRRSPGNKYATHPCNLVHDFESQNFETIDKKAGNKKIICHRLTEVFDNYQRVKNIYS